MARPPQPWVRRSKKKTKSRCKNEEDEIERFGGKEVGHVFGLILAGEKPDFRKIWLKKAGDESRCGPKS